MLEVAGKLLEERSGGQLVVANLARDVGVAPNTIKSWVDALCALQVGFLVRPWHRNVSSSLRKEPKWYLRDWSGIADTGKRFETLVACHLLKASFSYPGCSVRPLLFRQGFPVLPVVVHVPSQSVP